ncbi:MULTISPECIES: hypothetical protein [Pseudomonas]|uniref:hypothetical protein n=1 Tax=Pseudomonas TaxID=286 RepID=UPI0008DACD26|nr:MULTISPECIES: hypothetical protein [Pseudomonas]NMY99716.1 hypothetical protein [Pseudomonas proteolytica]OHW41352.1 hypothetical protein BHC62_12180 [Pseudomonas sp. 06C 126]
MKIAGGSYAAPIEQIRCVATMKVMTTGIEIMLAVLIRKDVVINYTLSECSAQSTTTTTNWCRIKALGRLQKVVWKPKVTDLMKQRNDAIESSTSSAEYRRFKG